jgi:hypothetical protein
MLLDKLSFILSIKRGHGECLMEEEEREVEEEETREEE